MRAPARAQDVEAVHRRLSVLSVACDGGAVVLTDEGAPDGAPNARGQGDGPPEQRIQPAPHGVAGGQDEPLARPARHHRRARGDAGPVAPDAFGGAGGGGREGTRGVEAEASEAAWHEHTRAAVEAHPGRRVRGVGVVSFGGGRWRRASVLSRTGAEPNGAGRRTGM